MQTAKNYVTASTNHMEQALGRMPIIVRAAKPLPSTMQGITRYVENLLTPTEQRTCDMATD